MLADVFDFSWFVGTTYNRVVHEAAIVNGACALGLQRVLGLGNYKTAWTWLHKLRRAMVRPGRDRLSGRVEVDETYLGGLEEYPYLPLRLSFNEFYR